MPTKALLHVFELVHHPEKNSLFCVTISGGKPHPRSEERRGGEEGRVPGGADHLKKKKKIKRVFGILNKKNQQIKPLLQVDGRTESVPFHTLAIQFHSTNHIPTHVHLRIPPSSRLSM